MSTPICTWSFLSSLVTALPENLGKSFAQAVTASDEAQPNRLPPRIRMGDKVYIKISQKVYEAEIADCQLHLHGRVTLQKGDPSLTTRGLKQKLVEIWPQLRNWFVTPLGRGFFEFKFQSMEDMKKVWAMNSVNLKSGILKNFYWSKDFDPLTQTQSHAQLWIRLMHLPQEYWRQTTLFDIAFGFGTPISINKATQSRLFGHYARILVDVDMSDTLFETVVVEREGYAFPVIMEYKRKLAFYQHCKLLVHYIQQCHRLNSTQPQVYSGYQPKNFTKQEVQKSKDASVLLVSQKVTTMIESLQFKYTTSIRPRIKPQPLIVLLWVWLIPI